MSQRPINTDLVTTILGEETSFKGVLHSQKSVRIEGQFEGEINTQGELHVGIKSKVKANIVGQHVVVAGEVIGNIEAIHGLHIAKTGKVYGDISGDRLMVDEGAIYKGRVNMDVISSKNLYEGASEIHRG
jgi:cytoskeletal protein CcmA (bactofilin family)